MSIDKLPPLDLNDEDIRAGLENARYHNGNVADELSCRERQLSEALDRIAALEMERDTLRAALHGVIDEMAWAEFDPDDADCWYGDSIKLLSQPPEYWAEKVKEEK